MEVDNTIETVTESRFVEIISQADFAGSFAEIKTDELFGLAVKAKIIEDWDIIYDQGGEEPLVRSYSEDEAADIISALVRYGYWEKFATLMTRQHSWGGECEAVLLMSALITKVRNLMHDQHDERWGTFNVIKMNLDKSEKVVFRMFGATCLCWPCVKTCAFDIITRFGHYRNERKAFKVYAQECIKLEECHA